MIDGNSEFDDLIAELGLGFRLGSVVPMLVMAEGHAGTRELYRATELIEREIIRREKRAKEDADALRADGEPISGPGAEGALRDRVVAVLHAEAPRTFHVQQLKDRLQLDQLEYRLMTKVVSVLSRRGIIQRCSRGVYGAMKAKRT